MTLTLTLLCYGRRIDSVKVMSRTDAPPLSLETNNTVIFLACLGGGEELVTNGERRKVRG